jgi:hypothetical protein
MATEYIWLPGQLLEKVKEAAAKEEVARRSWFVMPWSFD